MDIATFTAKLDNAPESIDFKEVIALIDSLYSFTPTAFRNGNYHNEAGQNNGSCKLFSFANMHGLSQAQTLACFGDYYRKDVLENPNGMDHQNIRNFMQFGWSGIEFQGNALTPLR